MSAAHWIALALVVVGAALSIGAGFLAGVRHEWLHRSYRPEGEHLRDGRGYLDAERSDAAADLRDSRRADRDEPAYWPWRQL